MSRSLLGAKIRGVRFERVCFEERIRPVRLSGMCLGAKIRKVRFERMCFEERIRPVRFSG